MAADLFESLVQVNSRTGGVRTANRINRPATVKFVGVRRTERWHHEGRSIVMSNLAEVPSEPSGDSDEAAIVLGDQQIAVGVHGDAADSLSLAPGC